MMKYIQRISHWWRIGFVCLMVLMVTVPSCRRKRHSQPAAPANQASAGLNLKIVPGLGLETAKVSVLQVEFVGLGSAGQPSRNPMASPALSVPEFPVQVNVNVGTPPCAWRITVNYTVTRGQAYSQVKDVNVCEERATTIVLTNAFEPFSVPGNPLHVPDSVWAGEAMPVSCGPVELDAPDSDHFPVTAILSESGGDSVSGPISATEGVSTDFIDPYPMTSPATERVVTCVIADGRSPDLTFTAVVQRFPDIDNDKVTDAEDNCPEIANTDQADSDGDELGDACDICPNDPENDADNDGICGDIDICPNDPDNDKDKDGVCGDTDVCPGFDDNVDTDGDGVPDGCDTCPKDSKNDADKDGVCGDVDICPGFADNVDADGDGVPDGCDICPNDAANDADNDGVCGDVDICPNDAANDADNDGVCGDVDVCPGFDDNQDADSDGVPDGCDTCGGYLFDGKCWYLATSPSDCSSVCGSHGGVDISAEFFWNAHTDANCGTVLNALGACTGFVSALSPPLPDACYCIGPSPNRQFGAAQIPNIPNGAGEACACAN